MLHKQRELVLVNKAEEGANHERAALAGAGGDEVQVGLLIRAAQADDQVIGMWGVHGCSIFGVVIPISRIDADRTGG
jgi:hypothetical protein